MSTDEVLNQIDGALRDTAVSMDAMRCNRSETPPTSYEAEVLADEPIAYWVNEGHWRRATYPEPPKGRWERTTDRLTRLLERLWLWHTNHRRNR